MENVKNVKVTINERLNQVKKFLIENNADEELVNFINERIEKNLNKNKSKSTKERPENAEILEMILKALKDNGEMTIAEMLKLDEFKNYAYVDKDETKNLSVSKIIAILQKECGKKEEPREESKIKRNENGKKITFMLK